jgi:hypothetical protein
MPLHRAKAKRAQVERELSKCPDFQLYLITKSVKDRTRMERLLMLNPNFRLWRALTSSIASAASRSDVSKTTGRNGAHVRLHDLSDRDHHGRRNEDNEEKITRTTVA